MLPGSNLQFHSSRKSIFGDVRLFKGSSLSCRQGNSVAWISIGTDFHRHKYVYKIKSFQKLAQFITTLTHIQIWPKKNKKQSTMECYNTKKHLPIFHLWTLENYLEDPRTKPIERFSKRLEKENYDRHEKGQKKTNMDELTFSCVSNQQPTFQFELKDTFFR